MNKVIFIAGTAYSGSTMLDMMLGNSDSSFSMGEVRRFFYPVKEYHFQPECGCGDINCDIWPSLKKYGPHDFYEGVFERYHHIDTIVDSSKDLLWIKAQRERLQKRKINSQIILIYKTPLEFALSRFKRNQLKGWENGWSRYHRLLMTLFDDWYSVCYHDLASHPAATLGKVCGCLQIEFKEGMQNYWEKTHHLLFGNLSARYHTIDKKADSYEKTVDHLTEIEKTIGSQKTGIGTSYRSIKYSIGDLQVLPQSAIANGEKRIFKDLMNFIESKDVANDTRRKLPDLRGKYVFPWPAVALFFLKRHFANQFFSLKFRI